MANTEHTVTDVSKLHAANDPAYGRSGDQRKETHAVVGHLSVAICTGASLDLQEAIRRAERFEELVRESLRVAVGHINTTVADPESVGAFGAVGGLTIGISAKAQSIETSTPNDPSDRH